MTSPSADEKRLADYRARYDDADNHSLEFREFGHAFGLACRLLDAAQARVRYEEKRAEEREVAIAGLKTRLLQAERERDDANKLNTYHEDHYRQALLRATAAEEHASALAAELKDAIPKFVAEVERRAEANMLKTHKLEGAHYAAMKAIMAERAALSSTTPKGEPRGGEANPANSVVPPAKPPS